MNRQECAKVLAKIQLVDNRQVDALTLEEWFDTIGHLPFETAVRAVTLHRQESTEWIQPAHVIKNVSRVRESIQADVRSAIARGLVPATWDRDNPIPAEAKEKLHELRQQARERVIDAGGLVH